MRRKGSREKWGRRFRLPTVEQDQVRGFGVGRRKRQPHKASPYANLRLASAAVSKPANSLRSSLGKAAAAIMAALSVARPGEGK